MSRSERIRGNPQHIRLALWHLDGPFEGVRTAMIFEGDSHDVTVAALTILSRMKPKERSRIDRIELDLADTMLGRRDVTHIYLPERTRERLT